MATKVEVTPRWSRTNDGAWDWMYTDSIGRSSIALWYRRESVDKFVGACIAYVVWRQSKEPGVVIIKPAELPAELLDPANIDKLKAYAEVLWRTGQ